MPSVSRGAGALAVLAVLCLGRNVSGAAWFEPHASVDVGVRSAYISRGRVIEHTPIQANDIDVRFDLSGFGRFGLDHWNCSSLGDSASRFHRRAFHELDWTPYYGYAWRFSDGWSLDSEIRPQWQAYYGGVRRDPPTSFELDFVQSIKNPYVTPFWMMRYTFEPVRWGYYVVGLKRTFVICRYLRLTPRVSTDFADGAGRRRRFGPRSDGTPYGAGILSVVAELKAEVPITDWFSLYAAVGQFDVLDSGGRDNLRNDYQRDLTYGNVGIILLF